MAKSTVNLTDEELKKAFFLWQARAKENHLLPFLSHDMLGFKIKQKSWLKEARIAQFQSKVTVANQLNISAEAYSKYEENEKNGVISLATLAKAAEALDCELVYAIRPKNRKPFSQRIWEIVLPFALKSAWLSNCDPKRRSFALVAVVKRLLEDTQFRKDRGWSQRIQDK